MNFFSKLTIILAILILNACSKNEKEISLSFFVHELSVKANNNIINLDKKFI